MESSTTWIYPILLLNHLPLYLTTTDHVPVTDFSPTTNKDPMGTSYPSLDSDITANDVANGTVADCLIDNKMAMVAVASAGGVIVCLLVSTLILAWQVRHLHHRIGSLRPSRSNMDLGSSSGCTWPLLASHDPSDPPEAGGLEGPCDATIVLEEMRPFLEIDATEDRVNTEKEKELEQGEKKAACHPGEMVVQIQSSSTSDARLDSKDLENMPLVV